MHMAWLALGGMLCSLQLSTGSFPRPLKPQEEQLYLERAAKGDIEARNILIERNLRLVAHIMKKYYAAESDQEDLISIGTIGLIKAVSSYKMDKNIRLATYASRCIEKATRTTGKVCHLLTDLRLDHLRHKISNGSGGIELARRTSTLEFFQDAFVDLAKSMDFGIIAQIQVIDDVNLCKLRQTN